MKRIFNIFISGLPLMVISGLLYAGLFIKPKPFGGHLQQPLFERDDRFYGIATAPEHTVWLVGAHGRVMRSDDAAQTWRSQASHVLENLQDVAAWDAQRAVAVGDQGVVVATQDGGATWREINVPHSGIANKLVRVKTLPGGLAWAVGEGGIALRSSDYGATWVRVGTDEDVSWNDIAFVDQQGWRVGEFGRIEKSVDGGASWLAQTGPAKVSLMGVAFRDERNGVAVGLGGTVLTTDDGGQRWHLETQVTPEHLFDVIWDGQHWLTVGDKGVVLVGDMDGHRWRPTRGAPVDRDWHTKVAVGATHYYFSGTQPLVTEKHAL